MADVHDTALSVVKNAIGFELQQYLDKRDGGEPRIGEPEMEMIEKAAKRAIHHYHSYLSQVMGRE